MNKNYTLNDINKWGEKRVIVKKNIRKYYDNKKKEKQKKLEQKDTFMNNIYNKEFTAYPVSLRQLIGKL